MANNLFMETKILNSNTSYLSFGKQKPDGSLNNHNMSDEDELRFMEDGNDENHSKVPSISRDELTSVSRDNKLEEEEDDLTSNHDREGSEDFDDVEVAFEEVLAEHISHQVINNALEKDEGLSGLG
ncbi:hypothetical protein L1887_01153 [Cichorium endivia]|nr:hypothetical protein L1887_01153 [Cichorium endivia]